MASQLDAIVSKYEKQEEAAKLANMKREDQVTAIYDSVIQRYQPGGGFQEAGMAEIGKQKTRDVGAATQNMISGGMFNTEAAANLGTGWEASVGSGARMTLEDTMMQRLSGAELNKAGFLERIENAYPDTSGLMGAAGQIGRGGGWEDPPDEPQESYADLKSRYQTPTANTGGAGKDYYKLRPWLTDPAAQQTQQQQQQPAEAAMTRKEWDKSGLADRDKYHKGLSYNSQYTTYKNSVSKYQSPTAKGIESGDTATAMQRPASTYTSPSPVSGPSRAGMNMPSSSGRYTSSPTKKSSAPFHVPNF